MRSRRTTAALAAVLTTFALVVAVVPAGGAQPAPTDGVFDHGFSTPVLGMNVVPNKNRVIVADAGKGIVRVGRSNSTVLADLPGVADVLPMNDNRMFAITAAPPEPEMGDGALAAHAPAQTLFVVRDRGRRLVRLSDLGAHEARRNPDGGEIDSNPFDLAKRGGLVFVADAGANAVIAVRVGNGRTRTVATFPTQLADTAWLKLAVNCPDAPPDAAELCDLPPQLPAESVPTSVAIGPDGYLYVGELIGFPGGPGLARVWRVAPGTWNADCGSDPRCEVVLSGFTSIIDLAFTSDGDLVVAEMDRATFLAAENGLGIGGAVSVCVLLTGTCTDVATGLDLLTSIAVGRGDRLFAAVLGLVPGGADVVSLGRV